ncbi:hypothetical protein [Methylomonas sp. AM2-LC]|uniref:hypothetical protein n=1 Tax=Methylomonas sp. AM2-LC TaxID=3153301 RepID=UPI003265DA93
MKNIYSLAGMALLTLSLSQQAQADVLVNTGDPSGNGYFPSTLDGTDWVAAQFTISQDQYINSIQGYLIDNGNAEVGNTFTITVYDSNPSSSSSNSIPAINVNTANQEFTGDATFTGNGWNGLSGINNNAGFFLAAGTYWVAFEIGNNGNNDSFQGAMPVSTSTPLAAYAAYSGGSYYNYSSAPGNDIGVQISSVPVPPSVLLFVSGLFAVGRFGKRKAS